MLWLVLYCRCASTGTAFCGTDPGSVNEVLAWHDSAIACKKQYIMAKDGGTPPVLANSVTVIIEYIISSHTKAAIIDPAWSPEFIQIPASSFVPKVQAFGNSLKLSK